MKKNYTFLFIFLFIFVLVSNLYSRTKSLSVGEIAPSLSAASWINGEINESKIKNHPVVVEFWATWCPPCRKAIPHINKLYARYKKKGVIFVGLTNEPYVKVKSFVDELKMKYIVGTGSKSGEKYGVSAIPIAFIIDHTGKIAWVGHPNYNIEKEIEKVLKKVPEEVKNSYNDVKTKEVGLKNETKK